MLCHLESSRQNLGVSSVNENRPVKLYLQFACVNCAAADYNMEKLKQGTCLYCYFIAEWRYAHGVRSASGIVICDVAYPTCACRAMQLKE